MGSNHIYGDEASVYALAQRIRGSVNEIQSANELAIKLTQSIEGSDSDQLKTTVDKIVRSMVRGTKKAEEQLPGIMQGLVEYANLLGSHGKF